MLFGRRFMRVYMGYVNVCPKGTCKYLFIIRINKVSTCNKLGTDSHVDLKSLYS